MHLHTLKEFRHGVYSSFGRARDALFNLVDALLSEDRAQSFPELSLSPHFERRWPSLYEAKEHGRVPSGPLSQLASAFNMREYESFVLRMGSSLKRGGVLIHSASYNNSVCCTLSWLSMTKLASKWLLPNKLFFDALLGEVLGGDQKVIARTIVCGEGSLPCGFSSMPLFLLAAPSLHL